MKKFGILLIVLFGIYQYIFTLPPNPGAKHNDTHTDYSVTPIATTFNDETEIVTETTYDNRDNSLAKAIKNRSSHVQVKGSGTVVKVLRDDRQGSQHQKFILRLPSGQTLLVAHNIDLAPRINHIKRGDTVEFYGQYEWSPKGGTLHWTHHDPRGHHASGWLKHYGRTYK
jgi:hypothetical protein